MTGEERILLIGSGAREHAIAWKIKKDNPHIKLFVAPGNAGTTSLGTNVGIDITDIDNLAAFARNNRIDFTIVGNEIPLSLGIVNLFNEKGMAIFGHTKEAAILESDKAEAVLFMQRHKIPHPNSAIFTKIDLAKRFVENCPWRQIVIKASGLFGGKGVILPDSKFESLITIDQMMKDKLFGEAGEKIVIQERLHGVEASIIGFVSNEIGLLVPAQDYKRAWENDLGPNTGGMGAFAPSENISSEKIKEIYDKILIPTVEGMRKEGRPLSGILYTGIMITADGPKVIEYNVRFGDPETQVQLRLLESNLLESMKSTVNGTLSERDYRSRKGFAVGVVVAAEGYPGKYSTGHRIYGLEKVKDSDVVVFHAGTRKITDGAVASTGGRVLTITATGDTKDEARNKVYEAIGDGEGKIMMEKGYFRKDIARQSK